jgi:beta-glucanase (GH16 family)
MIVKATRSDVYFHQQTQWWSLKCKTILAVLIGLIALSPLAGCSNRISRPDTNTAPTATATPDQAESPWKLVWSDEFDGPAGTPPDPNKWTPQVGGGGWGNQQLEYDTSNQNASQDGHGNLVLEAIQGNPAGFQCWYGPCLYTSAHISTSGHFSFTYGRIEASIKIPYGQGMWPTFWLLGNNYTTVGWPACGEIDIMENIGQESATIHGTAHGPGEASGGSYSLKQGKFADSFHIFALQWDPDYLYFMVDGVIYHTVDRSSLPNQEDWVYGHPFSIILNLAVGGVWPGSPNSTTVFPQKMYISYVRVYTLN